MFPSHNQAPDAKGKRSYIVYAWLGALTIFFLAVATIDLANYRPIASDEGWILSASYKVARQGIFGSDMYVDFFNADRHYFIALPGHHLLQALFLRLFGYGIAQARWASVISGLALLWAVSIIALRWYGSAVAILTSLLLLFWQPALVGEGAVPLVSLSRSLRYDLPAVAWIWLSILCFDRWLQRPTPARSFLTGVTAAVATLTQFFGMLALIIVPLGACVCRKRRTLSRGNIVAWLAGVLSLIGPYLLYVILHWQDASAQTTYLKGERANFGLGALLRNISQEPRRYQHLLEQIDIAPGPWVLLLGVGPTLAYLGIRLRRNGRRADRLLLLAMVTPVLFLALVDTTKAAIYALPLLPPLCIAFALLTVRLLNWAIQGRQLQRRAIGIGVLTMLGLSILHGFHFYYRDFRAASSVSNYQALGRAIDAAARPGAAVAGSERWWWPLRHRNFLALNNLSAQWRVRRDKRGQTASFASLVTENEIGQIIVDADAHGNMRRQPERLQQQFWAFLRACTTQQAHWNDVTYGEIILYAVESGCG